MGHGPARTAGRARLPVLAVALAATGAIGSPVYVALIGAVAISIAATTVLVRVVPGSRTRQAEAG